MCLARQLGTMAHSKGPPTPLRKQDSPSSDTKTSRMTTPALADLDLSHLTSEEIGAIQKVLKKQESFERQAKLRADQIEKAIRRYEATLAARESHPPRSKDDDMRMCRLCFVRKFTDGLGNTCGDCLHRVCTNCSSQVQDGGGTSPTPKHRFKHKKRWRCNLCKLQRDYLCVTGRWYYQDEAAGEPDPKYRNLSTPMMGTQSPSGTPPRRRVVRSAQSDLEERFVNRNVEAIKRNSWDSGKHYKSDTEASSSTCLREAFARESLNGKKSVTRRRRRSSQLRQISCDSPGDNMTQESDEGEWMNRALARRASHRRPLRRRRYGVTEPGDKSPEGSQMSKGAGQQASGSEDERPVSVADAERSPSSRRRSRPSIHGRRSPSGAVAPREPPLEGQQVASNPAQDRAKEARGKYKRTGSVKADFIGKFGQRAMERFRRRSRSESELNIPEQPTQETTIYVRDDSEEVTIRKDPQDTSCKTRGFGLELVGGRQDSDGWLRAFVTRVVVDGPAHKVDVHKGDETLEWNGQSLENKTFEQVRQIVDQPCGDELKLRIVRYQAHRGTETLTAKRGSSVSIESEVYHRRKKISVCMQNSINTEQYREMFTPAPEETANLSASQKSGSRRKLPVPPQSSLSTTNASSNARTAAPRVELTPAENQNLGELCMQLTLREETKELVVVLMEAKGLRVREGDPLGQPPSPYVNIYQLPYRRESLRYRSPTIPATATPIWNKTFVFPNVTQSEIAGLSLEFTVWDERPDCMNLFLGEVLIDLQDEPLNGKPVWYPLADHDENIGDMPCTAPPGVVLARLQQQHNQAMGIGLMDAPHLLTPYLTAGGVGHRELARCPSDSVREYGRGREGLMPLSLEAASQLQIEDRFDRLPLSRHRSCPTAGSNAYNKMTDLPQIIVAGPSEDTWPEMFNERRKRSSSSFGSSIAGSSIAGSDWESCTSYSSGSRNSMDSDYHFRLSTCSMPRPAPDGEDGMITEPGPGQVLLENFNGRPCGFIKLAMAVSKGSLEVEIICATGLLFHGEPETLDTYVKTYLLEGDRQLVKRKTKVMHATCEPHYAQTLKYSACDITGRRLQVMLWRKTKIRESNQCLGEARITLDILEETTHSTAWYTLFPSGAYESLKSSQSLELLKF